MLGIYVEGIGSSVVQLIEDHTIRAGAVHGLVVTKFSIDGTVWTLKLRE